MPDTGSVKPATERPPDLREEIRRQAKVVGLRELQLPSLESVERRRLQLWVLTTVLLLAVSAAILLLWVGSGVTAAGQWLNPRTTTGAILALAVGFGVYAIEKELHLQRLTKLLVEERALNAALSNRLRELSTLLEAGKAMNSVLELRDVLDIILRSALELLEAPDGSIMLLEEDDELVVVCSYGNEQAEGARVRLGEGIAGRVAEEREALLLVGEVDGSGGGFAREHPVESAMCFPLVNRDDLLGVLNVNAASENPFTEYDLRALGLFAEHAASAIANARLYEASRARVVELLELDRMKREFIASVSHDLRTPLTSILGSVSVAKRDDVGSEHRDELLAVVERQARHLNAMVEQLLAASELERAGMSELRGTVDLAALVRAVALDSEASGRSVTAEAPESVEVRGEADALRRIVENLLDNAFKHGAPPVCLSVERDGDEVLLSVVDAGPGIDAEARTEIFERFHRLEGSRGSPGIGLGLSNVRVLAQACGGAAWVEDAPHGGAAFRVRFQVPDEEASESEGERTSASAGLSDQDPSET